MASRDAGAWALPVHAEAASRLPPGSRGGGAASLAQRLFPTPAGTPAGTPASARPPGTGAGGGYAHAASGRGTGDDAALRWAALDAEAARLEAQGRELAAKFAQHSAAVVARAPRAAPPPAQAQAWSGGGELFWRQMHAPLAPATAPARAPRPVRADQLLQWALEAEAEGAAADAKEAATAVPIGFMTEGSLSAEGAALQPPALASERAAPQSAPPAPRPTARASAPAHGPEPGRGASAPPPFEQSPPLQQPPPHRPPLEAPPPRESPRQAPPASPRWSAPRTSTASSAEILPLPSDEEDCDADETRPDSAAEDGRRRSVDAAAARRTPPGSARSSHVSWAEPPVSERASADGSIAEEWRDGGDGDGSGSDGDDVARDAGGSPSESPSAEPTWDFPAVLSPPPQPPMAAARRSAGAALPASAGALAAAWRAANGETDANAPTPPPRTADTWQALPASRQSMERQPGSLMPGNGDGIGAAEAEVTWQPRSMRMAEFPHDFAPEPTPEPVELPPLLLPHAKPPSPLAPRGSVSVPGGIAGGLRRVSEKRPDPKTIGLQPPPSPAAALAAKAPVVAATPPPPSGCGARQDVGGVPSDVAACFAAFHAAGDGADGLRLRAGGDAGFIYSAFGFLVSAEDTLTKCAVALHASRGWTARAHTALDADEAAAAADGDDEEEEARGKTPAHNKLLWQLPLERLEAAWWSADGEDDELMLLDAGGAAGDARLLLPARDVAIGALAAFAAQRGAALEAADTSDDPRRPWLGDRGPGGRQLQLLPAAAESDDGDAPTPQAAAAPAQADGSEEGSTSDDSSDDDSDDGPRRPQWRGSGLRRSG